MKVDHSHALWITKTKVDDNLYDCILTSNRGGGGGGGGEREKLSNHLASDSAMQSGDKGSGPEWYISSMLYSRDIPVWSGTLELLTNFSL